MRSEMSLGGLYNYDETVLDELQLPEQLGREEFVKLLLVETMDLEVLYPQPDFFRAAVGAWSSAMIHSWEKMAAALYKEYQPLENYDRHETWTDNNTRTDNTTRSVTGGSTDGGTVGITSGGTVTGSAQSFNANTFKGRDKEESTGSSTTTTNLTRTDNSTETNTGTVGNSGSRTGTIHGNIGVTSAQDMLTQEMVVRMSYQLSYIIIQQFKERFCLLVY